MDHKLFSEHQQILIDVLDERQRQDDKFGIQRSQHPFLWNTILVEEVGEVAEASLDVEFSNHDITHYRKELVEVAAVAIAAILDLDLHGKFKR